MATQEEQAHAARLLKIHERNLKRLEERKALLGGALDLALDNQIAQEEADISVLRPIAKPPPKPSPKIEAFAKQVSPSDIDLTMLYMQGVQINARMTRQEEQNDKQEARIDQIIEEQGRASVWRMQTSETVDGLVVQTAATERARIVGSRWWRRVLVITVSMAVLALMVSCAAFAAVMR